MTHFTTIERSFDDFIFLRQELLNEIPELFLPTLGSLYHPNNVDLGPSPRILLESALTKITQFMDYLQRHPILRKHEQVQSFVRTQELNVSLYTCTYMYIYIYRNLNISIYISFLFVIFKFLENGYS